MRAAWRSLRELVLDWKYLGGLPGAVAVFQSWDDEMREHCHLHFIVTGGGLDDDGRWVGASNEFLLPTPVLAAKFRGKFLGYLKEALCKRTATGAEKDKSEILRLPYGMSRQKCLNLLNKLGRKRWHADIEPAYSHANGVLNTWAAMFAGARSAKGGSLAMTAKQLPSVTPTAKSTKSRVLPCRCTFLSAGC